MLEDETINQRLEIMAQQDDPMKPLWPENCAGSRKALVIFVGPSPGGKKEGQRREINPEKIKPHWNESYSEPLETWSKGFAVSFKPIVEAIFGGKYKYDVAGKLVARANLDWLGNPESRDVSYRYMWEGSFHVLRVIHNCEPDLIVPMDMKSFGVLQIALCNDDYEITPINIGTVKVKISNEGRKYHRNIVGFKAEKDRRSFLVIKSLQHPARIYNDKYAERVGKAIRSSVEQISNGKEVNLSIE